MANVRKVAFVIFSCICVASATQNTVPVLFWSDQGPELPSLLAGHKLSSEKFHSDYLQNLAKDGKRNFVALLQDKLSLEDITRHADVYSEQSSGGTFQNLKHLMESHNSVHLPRVETPAETLNTLKSQFQGKVHELKAPYHIKDLPLDPDGGNLVIAHLPDTNGGESQHSKSLQNIDEILGSVTDGLKSLGKPYTAMYTGKQNSEEYLRRENLYMGRHLLAGEDKDMFFNGSGCIFFYATAGKFELFKMDKNNKVLQYSNYTIPNEATKVVGNCDNGTNILTVNWTITEGELQELGFNINFTSKNGMWNIQSWMVYYKVVNKNGTFEKDVSLKTGDIYAPLKFSYHCTNPSPLRQNVNLNSSNDQTFHRIQLHFDNWQIQPITIVKDQFGTANDCTGFFTIPIWSGIISGVVLVAILMFGLHMISDINTPDRFDDPKGKTISVNVNE